MKRLTYSEQEKEAKGGKPNPNPHSKDETFEETEKEDREVLQSALDILAARFDTVQVFVTRVQPITSQTMRISDGWGNWYARLGHCATWVHANMGTPDELT